MKMIEAAGDFGLNATFFDKPGALAKWADYIRRYTPWNVGRIFVPFVNTLVNLQLRGIEYTPVLGLLRLKSMDSTTLMARQLGGTIFTLLMLGTLWDEDKFTGGVPKERAKRLLWDSIGKEPYSFKVGKYWVPYDRIEPFGSMIANIIAFRDGVKETQITAEKRDVDWTDYFGNVAHYTIKNVTRSYVASNLLRAVTASPESRARQFRRIPSTFVPHSNFMRSIARTLEGWFSEEREIKDRENYNIWVIFMHLIPWGSFTYDEKMPVKVDALGEEIAMPAQNNLWGAIGGTFTQWLPISWTEELPQDTIEQELMRLEHYPSLPNRWLTIGRGLRATKFYLEDEMYRDYCLLYGKATKDAFRAAMNNPSYAGMSDERKIRYLDRRSSVARDHVRRRAERRVKKLGLHIR